MASSLEKKRWEQEAEFFDREALHAMQHLEPVGARTLERYGVLRRRRFIKEFRFRVMGALAGMQVLEIGCGDGINAMNFAKLGATVTGIDISTGAIALARKRAEINGVSDRCTFVCTPLEVAQFDEQGFDIVCGTAILHHVIPDLDAAVRKAVSWAKPGGIVMFDEPVALNRLWRRFRLLLPIATYATPGERPLEQQELDIVSRHLVGMKVRYFSLFSRLIRYILINRNYEASPAPRRMLYDLLCTIDYAILCVPGLRGLAGSCVMYGRAKE